MPYILYQFGDLVLPAYNGENDISTIAGRPAFIDLPGGRVFDASGADDSPTGATPLTKRCTLDADNAAQLRVAFNALRANPRKRKRLWRLWDSGDAEWCWARFLGIQATRTTKNHLHQEMELQFVMISPRWYGGHHGGAWTLDNGIVLDTGYELDADDWRALTAGANSLTITNNGNRTVTNAVITVAAGSANITALKIGVSGVSELQYATTIDAGESVEIDCGALSVLNHGIENYAGFGLTANHKIDDWLRLEPGENTVVVTITGGGTGAQALFEFFDGWE